ncbi:peptidase [Niastella koreensis]|uniref:PepSY-associated TM helix domain protein n=3 Tax=Niastella koreensis TaxID=354356 RepID=G8TGY0_NIAKG|nr:PepSY-associated TM helix domain protein [Niastella koreensis GR20-10]OQP50173.1 peptidase [Niastella koreensis]
MLQEKTAPQRMNWLTWYRKTAMLMRWLHIYLSMISFAVVFFFAITGLTLNHADKFVNKVRTIEEKGKMNKLWVNNPDTLKIARLEIVEYLRKNNSISAPVSDFRIDETQIGVSFKGPGYAADAFIDRETGNYDLTKTSAGFVGVINDLHKGRDTGAAWSTFIDICAILLTLVSFTGMLLLLFLKKRRASGLMVAVFGLLLGYFVYMIWIK